MAYCNTFYPKTSYNYPLLLLLISLWICGIFFGCCCAANAASVIPPLIHSLTVRHVSFVGMLISSFVPLSLTILVSYFSLPILLPVLAFVKAFTFSFTTFCIFYTFGSSSWLIQILMLSSNSIAVILLFWLWTDVLTRGKTTLSALFTFFAIVVVDCAIDCFVGSPFLTSLLHF